MKKLSSLLLLLLTVFPLSAQYRVGGKVVDSASDEPLAYANVVDAANQNRGTLTNLDGSFTLNVDNQDAELIFSYLGYQNLRIKANQLGTGSIVRLKAESITLAQVEVMGNNDALYEAVIDARKNLEKAGQHIGRVFFQLTTTTGDGEPIEILQSYYNGGSENGRIRYLDLKNGRIAVTGKEELAFSNLSTSRAFAYLDLLKGGPFPSQPLELGAMELRRAYDLRQRPDFSNSNLLHFNFEPYTAEQSLFTGEMWVDRKTNSLKKLVLRKENMQEHPFTSLQETDLIREIDLEVSYTFQEISGRTVINYIQLDYQMELVENAGTAAAKVRTLNCQGIMQFYAPNQLFFLSLPRLSQRQDDYNAVYNRAYDAKFWEQNQGLVFTEKQLEQQAYLEETGLLVNYPPNPDQPERKSRYLEWKPNQQAVTAETSLGTNPEDIKAIYKNTAVKFFVHIDNVNNLPVPRSTVLLDRYALYTASPKGNRYVEVLKLYFDLAEIARRNFDIKVAKKPREYDKLVQLYSIESFKLNRTHEKFISKMANDDGQLSTFQKWKAKIKKELAQTNK